MDSGVRIGVDVGLARIGVAATDPDGVLAFPVQTVLAGPDAAAQVIAIANEYQAACIYVGSPISLRGAETASTLAAQDFAQRLSKFGIAVHLVDERLSTVAASSRLHDAGRKVRKENIDQAAAVEILESALAYEQKQGKRAGKAVQDD